MDPDPVELSDRNLPVHEDSARWSKSLASASMHELADRLSIAHNVSSGIAFLRAGADTRRSKRYARRDVLGLFDPIAFPEPLSIITLPSLEWRFERQLLALRRDVKTTITAFESDEAIFRIAATRIPSFGISDIGAAPFASSSLADTGGTITLHRCEIEAFFQWSLEHQSKTYDAAWLDFTGPMTRKRKLIIERFWKERIEAVLAVTFMDARSNLGSFDVSGWFASLGHVIFKDRYVNETVPMCQVVIAKRRPVFRIDEHYATRFAGLASSGKVVAIADSKLPHLAACSTAREQLELLLAMPDVGPLGHRIHDGQLIHESLLRRSRDGRRNLRSLAIELEALETFLKQWRVTATDEKAARLEEERLVDAMVQSIDAMYVAPTDALDAHRRIGALRRYSDEISAQAADAPHSLDLRAQRKAAGHERNALDKWLREHDPAFARPLPRIEDATIFEHLLPQCERLIAEYAARYPDIKDGVLRDIVERVALQAVRLLASLNKQKT